MDSLFIGTATNIIQPEASVSYQIRSPKISVARKISERIDSLALGASIMTGTEVEIHFEQATSELRVNETLNDVLYDALCEIGRPAPDKVSADLADALYGTLPETAFGECARKAAISYGPDAGHSLSERTKTSTLIDVIYPRRTQSVVYGASTDVGDVSFCKPVGFLNIACFVKDAPLHSWQAVSFGKSPFAMEGMLTAARVIGAASIRLICEQELLIKASEEWALQNELEPYVNLITEDMQPPCAEA